MFGKKKDTPKVAKAVSAAVNYETTIADLAIRSAKRAWFVAFASILMSLLLAGGYYYMLPLKEKVPFLVMADAYTGNATVARLEGNFLDRSVTASEAINRSNVAHFVMMRESYDYSMMVLRDWRAVHSMSTPEVNVDYDNLYSKNNPNNPYTLYDRRSAIRVKILSITFIGGSATTAPKGATVRFQRSLYDKSNGAVKPLDSKIATMEFTYNKNLRLEERDRIENPLGFQVTSYRVESDFAPAPTLGVESDQSSFDSQPTVAPAPVTPPAMQADGTQAPAPAAPVSGAATPQELIPVPVPAATSPNAPVGTTQPPADGGTRR